MIEGNIRCIFSSPCLDVVVFNLLFGLLFVLCAVFYLLPEFCINLYAAVFDSSALQ